MMRSQFTRPHVVGVPLVMKQDKAFDPRDVRLLVLYARCRTRYAFATWAKNRGFPG